MPPPPLPPLETTRRAVLTGLLAGTGWVATGCSLGGGPEGDAERRATGSPDTPTPPDPDVQRAAAALIEEQAALDACAATLRRHRGLRSALAPVVAAHRAHVSLLAEVSPGNGAAPPSPSTGTAPFRVPGNRRAARRKLSSLELELSTSERRHAFAAESGAFARLLASMAAAAAQHAVLLDTAALSAGTAAGAAQP